MTLDALLAYAKDLRDSLKFQVSATVTFVTALALIFADVAEGKIAAVSLALFPTCMLAGSLIEKAIAWRKAKRTAVAERLKKKLGLMQGYQYSDKLREPWADKQFPGLAWQVYSNGVTGAVLIDEPVCAKCKTNLITRMNAKCDGYYFECTDCKAQFEVDDIGEVRSLANASLQGAVRRDRRKFFPGII